MRRRTCGAKRACLPAHALFEGSHSPRLVLALFSPSGLSAVREGIRALPASQRTLRVDAFDADFDRYRATIVPTLAMTGGVQSPVAAGVVGVSAALIVPVMVMNDPVAVS